MVNYFKHPAETYVMINDVYLDDVYRVDFSMDESKMPIYGYRDRLYNQVTKGKSKVVGNLFLNFSSPGYLYTALVSDAFKGVPGKESRISPYKEAENQLDQLNSEMSEIFKNNSSQEDRRKQISALFTRASRLGLTSQLAESLRYAFGSDGSRLVDKGTIEPTDSNIKPFKIKIYYGHPEDPGSIIREITECYLLGTNQVISAAGSPGGDLSSSAQVILEVYPFIGREIRTL